MLRILIEDSEGKSKLAPINPDAGDITIGRKEGNFIRLKERNVSRNHARIYQTPDGLFIEPVAARYGLKLNSSKIEGPTPLALGDEIRIGDYRLYIQDENKPNLKKEEDLNSVQDIPPEQQPRFVVISSNFAGREYHVMKTKVTIGRNTSSEICIEHQSVSGQHAEVRRNGRGDFEIRDLNSSNGTKVNGIPINEPWRLSSGDAVTLGHVTMRFCGPNDFWSLNFGINDEPKGGNKGIIALIGIAIIVVLALGFIYIGSILKPQQPQQPVQTANEDNDSKDKFNNYINDCQNAISKGDFDSAKTHCDLARDISPNDPKYLAVAEQLRKEKDSKDALVEVLESISNGDCRDAIDSLENIQKGTAAYITMLEKDYKTKALECLEKKLRDNALAAVERGEISEAERIRDEIKSQRENSPYLSPVDDAIRKAKSAARGGGGGGSRKSASANDAAPAPAPAAPAPAAIDVNELCSNAVRAKIGKDNCKAYELYKKAKKAGITDATCKRNADTHIAAFAAQCNK
ncbi:MAG: FHA domain-containing protein [Proteobacteria bacterium]|nr:FHA domain-containing protein [Pseudomonadota bacterium]